MVLLYSKFQELMVLFLNPTYIHLTKSVFLLLFKLLYGLVFVKGEILRLTYISYTHTKTEMLFFNKRLFNLNFSYREIRFEIVQLVMVWTTIQIKLFQFKKNIGGTLQFFDWQRKISKIFFSYRENRFENDTNQLVLDSLKPLFK